MLLTPYFDDDKMFFTARFDKITGAYFGVTRLEAIKGRTIATYEDGQVMDIGPVSSYPLLLNIGENANFVVQGKKLIITTSA